MLTRAVIGLSILLVVGAALIAPKLMKGRTIDVIADREATPAAGPVPDRVEVQQQIVRAVQTTEARRLERPVSQVVRKTAANRQAGPATFMQRATRTLVGDGRHRPEPFPRAR